MYSDNFASKVVMDYAKAHKKAFSDFMAAFPGIKKEYLKKIFKYNQQKWNAFKYCIKRIEKGHLTEVWLETAQEHKSIKTIKRIFRGIEVISELNKNGDLKYTEKHQYYYTKELYK